MVASTMQVFWDHNEAKGKVRGCSVAIGNFDGVHCGHTTLIGAAGAVPHSGPLVVLTFHPHPVKILKPALAPQLIMPLERRLVLLSEVGVAATVVEPFTSTLAGLSAQQFVDDLLLGCLEPDAVTVGYDFTYGSKRSGSVETLSQHLSQAGVEARVLAPVRTDGLVASSTKIREFVLDGRVEGAALVLGRPYAVWGEVVHGAGRGSGMGIKTLNLSTQHELLPRRGVYATWTVIPGLQPLQSVTNVGRNPTFGDEDLHIETHVLADIADQYGVEVEVRFISRLRDEKRFPGPAELVAQIGLDIQQTRDLLGSRSLGC